MQEINIPPRALENFAALGAERADRLAAQADAARVALEGRCVVNVNSTAVGGGVAEMLHVLLGYVRAGGIDTRWLVIEGGAEFFRITKRVHNHLYGTSGDGGPLGEAEQAIFTEVGRANAAELRNNLRSGDVVILHDPQTVGLAATAKAMGATVIWRCHVGIDTPDEHTERAWSFLRPHLEPHVDRYVFTRAGYAPSWVPPELLVAIAPSIDPFTPKNQELSTEAVQAILARIGILGGAEADTTFIASDGTPRRVDHYADLIRSGPPPPPDVPLVVQVSRWDPMKDMVGVIEAFAEHVDPALGAHLVLAGPAVNAVSDDPEAPEVLHACWEAWRDLPHAVRHRVQLACLPMHDLDENAVIVNALQRHATVIAQKSLAEGFGLTAVEAMLKGRPVVAGAVGGLVDQIEDGVTGLLVEPTDLTAFGAAVETLLRDPEASARLGEAGRDAAVESHLGDTHLGHWLDLIRGLAF